MKCSNRQLALFILLLGFQLGYSQTTSLTSYIFGHSLLDHRPPLIPTPSDETTVPHWMHLLAQEAGNSYSVSGQYGFLPQHANLPPTAQWGYDIVTPAWDSDVEPFSAANFNNILITAANFAQWQGPSIPYYGSTVSPISTTEEIVDWLVDQEDGLHIYIYENWPDMAPYLSGGTFPPSETDLAAYYDYTTGDFHDWWIEYHDSLLLSRPDANVRMIPVGPILAGLLTNTVLNQIPVTELYEDDAPHGRATLYFLAGMITYMATYETLAPYSYTVPPIIHSIVQDNYALVISYIWNELQNFNDANGASRVFTINSTLPVELIKFKARPAVDKVELVWTTQNEVDHAGFEIEYAQNGTDFTRIGTIKATANSTSTKHYHFEHKHYQLGDNYYRLKQVDRDGLYVFGPIVQVNMKAMDTPINCYPNPNKTGKFHLDLKAESATDLQLELWTLDGRLIQSEQSELGAGVNHLLLDYSQLNNGLYLLKIKQNKEQYIQRIRILRE